VKILWFEFEKENFISLFLFLGIIIFECQENYVEIFSTYVGKVDNG
jgi:hypothetical protein